MSQIQFHSRLTAIAALSLLAGASALAADSYQFTPLGTLGGSTSGPTAINRNGTAVGTAATPPNGDDPPLEGSRPAKWVKGPLAVDLGTLGGSYGHATDINDAGLIVGYTWLSGDSGVHATLWNGVSIVDLGTLGGSESYAYGINKSGVVVGNSQTAANRYSRAFAWKDGAMKVLKSLGGPNTQARDISDTGYIAGFSEDASGAGHAVLWKGKVIIDLGVSKGAPVAVNNAGVAVGSTSPGDLYAQATLWKNGAVQILPNLGGTQSQAEDINDSEVIVGSSGYLPGSIDPHAAMWVNGEVIDLNDKLDQATRDAGWILKSASAVNNRGMITGWAYNSLTGQSRGYALTPGTP